MIKKTLKVKMIQLLLVWLCITFCFGSQFLQAQNLVGNIITSSEELDGTGDAAAISDNGNRIIVGTANNPVYSTDSVGYARVYQLNGGTWQQLGQDLIEEKAHDEFGHCVEISSDGNRIGVGGSLGAIVYDLVENTWQQVGTQLILPGMDTLSSQIERIRFSEDGNTVAISGRSTEAPLIVYEYSGNNWIQKGNNFPADGRAEFGLSTDGNRVAFHASSTQPNHRRETRVFEFQNGLWNTLGDTIRFPDGYRWADGIDIAGNGNRVVISLENMDGSPNGGIATYDLIDNNWVQNGPLLNHEIFTSHNVTLRLSRDGNTFVIGNTFCLSDVDRTTVVVYQFINQEWQILESFLPCLAHDETAEGHVDITADGMRVVMGGVRTGPKDLRGYVKVYDFGNSSSVHDHSTLSNVMVFPNPVKDRLNIRLNEANEKIEIQILNLQGLLVDEYSVFGKEHIIELPATPGLYIINLIAENGAKQAFKVLKQ